MSSFMPWSRRAASMITSAMGTGFSVAASKGRLVAELQPPYGLGKKLTRDFRELRADETVHLGAGHDAKINERVSEAPGPGTHELRCGIQLLLSDAAPAHHDIAESFVDGRGQRSDDSALLQHDFSTGGVRGSAEHTRALLSPEAS